MTAEIESEEWKPVLEALGVECTLESALNMAMIREGLAGNVKAYEVIRDTLGQKPVESVKIENPQATKVLESISKQLKNK